MNYKYVNQSYLRHIHDNLDRAILYHQRCSINEFYIKHTSIDTASVIT